MKNDRCSFLFLVALVIGSVFFTTGLYAAMEPGIKCPIMKKAKAKEKFFVDHEGKRTYLCCKSCVKKFQKNPAKYLA